MNNSVELVAIGDSLTYGFPYTPSDSWLQLAALRLSFSYLNQGINGDTTNGMAARFRRDVLRVNPDYVILMGGTNDIYEGVDLAEIMGNMEEMTQAALQANIRPILGLPIPCNDEGEERRLIEYRMLLRNFAAAASLPLIDFYSCVVDQTGQIPRALDYDGIHPNKSGYQAMAQAALQTLARIFPEK